MDRDADFVYGAALTAVGAEGAALHSDWFAWEQAGNAPPSLDGNGFALDYADDLRLLASIGLRAVRLTVDWARIEPQEGHPDAAVLERYRDVLTAARDAGLTPWVTLADRTLPGWFAIDERGWRDRRARGYFWPRHVERCAEAFGDLAGGWVPIVRAAAAARAAFLDDTAPPALRSPQKFVETVQGSVLAALEAWRILGGASAPVATGFDVAPVRAGDQLIPTTRRARHHDEVLWAWTGGLRDGILQYPRLPPVQVPAMRDAFDLVGITFDGGLVVAADGRIELRSRPEDLLATLHRTADHAHDRPLIVLGETVTAGPGTDDLATRERLEEVLTEVDAARADGIDLRGWFWEPAIDGYELRGGFDRRLGLFDRDRNPKAAAAVISRRVGAPTDPA